MAEPVLLRLLKGYIDLDIHFSTWPAKGEHYALLRLSDEQAERFKYRLTFSLPERAPSEATK